MKLEIS